MIAAGFAAAFEARLAEVGSPTAAWGDGEGRPPPPPGAEVAIGHLPPPLQALSDAAIAALTGYGREWNPACCLFKLDEAELAARPPGQGPSECGAGPRGG